MDERVDRALLFHHPSSDDESRPQDLKSALCALGEREKELECAYAITRVLLDDTLSIDVALEQVVDLVAAAMRFSQHAQARIVFDGRRVATRGFTASSRGLLESIERAGVSLGRIEVVYGEGVADKEPAPFLPEERQMLANLATILGNLLSSRSGGQPARITERASVLEQIVNRSPTMVYLWQVTDGCPLAFVSESVRQLGYSSDQFYEGAIQYQDLIHPDDREKYLEDTRRHLAGGSDEFQRRYRIKTHSGAFRWVTDSTAILRDASGGAERIQSITTDISDQVEAEERARRYLKAAGSAFVVLDTHGRVVAVNDRALQITEETEENLIGVDWIEEFVPADERQNVRREFGQILERRDAPIVIREYENDIVSRKGRRRTIRWNNTIESDARGGVERVVSFGTDVTRRREAEKRAEDLARFPLENPNPVLRLDESGDVLLANPAAQELIDECAASDGQAKRRWSEFVSHARHVRFTESYEITIGSRTYLFHIAPGEAGKQINIYGTDISQQRENEARLTDIANDLPGAVFQLVLRGDGTMSIPYFGPGFEKLWGAPDLEAPIEYARLLEAVDLAHRPGLEASISDSAHRLSRWEAEWRVEAGESKPGRWLRGVGTPRRLSNGDVGWNGLITDVTQEKNSQAALSEALKKTIDVLATAAEVRDPYTSGHQDQVARIAVRIGMALELDTHRIEGLQLAAKIHDVGKIRIPAEILSKPTALSKAEYELVKEHPSVGAEIIHDIDFEWPIATIILQHHERLDGSGYPQGLKGDEILLEARIIAVADTLEAMASHRPYRPGLGLEVATNEIRLGAGVRYDPDVAAACLALVADGEIVV